MSVTQPVTLATDYALGLAAAAAAFFLARDARGREALPVRLWSAAFLALAAAAFLGGTWHGFSGGLPAPSASLLWKVTLAATGAASFFLLAGASFGSLSGRAAIAVTAAAAAKLLAFLVWSASHDEFDGVIVDSTAAMAAILVLAAVSWNRRRAPSSRWIAAGILLSAAAAAVEALPVSPGRLFSHDDLYHVVQVAAVYLLYRGGRLLRATSSGPFSDGSFFASKPPIDPNPNE